MPCLSPFNKMSTCLKTTTLTLLALSAISASATTISTSFSTGDGFVSRSTSDVVLTDNDFTVTFSGGVQEQSFDGPAYNAGPDAYFFVNAGPGTFTGSFGVRPLPGNVDVGTITFNTGVISLSFFAADRANGTPSFRLLDIDGNILTTESITGTSNRNSDGATPFEFSSSDFGGALFGSLEFDNAGPAANPPYVIAIDSFSATGVPEPSSALLSALGALLVISKRRR